MLYCEPYINEELKENIKIHYKLLIIEDSELFAKILLKNLAKYANYNVDFALTFEEAKVKFEQNEYNYIILDLHLPDAYGEELVDAVMHLNKAKIIVLTSESDLYVRESLFKKGIIDYLIKDKHFVSSIKAIRYNIDALEKNKNSTILVIEDSIFMAKQLQKILLSRNYNVLLAQTAADGLELLKNNNINTVILDMELPDKHGVDLLREMKDIDEICQIPVIVVSSTNDPEVVRNALKVGASDFIKKPFNLEEFILKVDLSIDTNRKYTEVLCTQKVLKEYKTAIDNSSLVSKTDTRGIITYVNDTFAKLSGYTKEELLGKSHNIVKHPDMPSSIFKEMWETIQSKQVWRGVIKNRKKNGDTYYVRSTISPIVDADDRIVEYIAIRTDITELESYRELLEERLSLSNNNLLYLSQYENAIDDFIATIKTNTNGTIIYINDNFCKLSGYSKKELLGKKCQELRALKHIKQGDCQKISKRLEKKEKVTMLLENRKKTGESYYVDTHIYPFEDKYGKIIEHVHLMYDVTETINLHQEIENTQKEIIYKMGEIGETRSKETGNHVKRVAEYSKLLAELIGLDYQHVELLYAASPMHDIGKVGIPDAILNKPGKLSDDEFEIMKTHSEIGFNILRGSNKPIIKAAAVVAYTHHEKYDGTGYPKGTRGKKIHIFGRITAIADVFDALGSDRCYKKAWELDKILELFKQERGKHFDPELIDLFFNNLDKFLAIRDKYKDT